MADLFKERIRFPMSVTELKRRHNAVKAEMEKQGLDMIIMSNNNQYLGGYIRYFTDIPASNAYPVTVLFEKTGEVSTYTLGDPDRPVPFEWAARVITNRTSLPYFRSLDYTKNYDVDAISKFMKSKNVKRLGLVGVGMLDYHMVSSIIERTGVKTVNFTPALDKIKMVKSPEEIKFIELSVKMHEDSIAFMQSILKPGMYEYDLRAELAGWLKKEGSEEQLLLLCSGPKVPHIIHPFYQNRQIQKGDYINVLNESSGPGGYYSEITRTFSMGEPAKEAVEAYAVAVELQHWVADMLAPGVPANTIWKKYNERLREMGLPEENRLFIHGQGYDLVEMPGFGDEDDTILGEGMYLAIHPTILFSSGHWGHSCEDFLVTADGYKDMFTALKQEIVIVDC
ncbi:MAG: M24 family metallopeptidase [Oscillospiraceae bacterium]|nr:M24 family metallopeptidase [Oscillospiraceae bacterium]